MTWRNRLKPASFRGVPFKTESHEASGGHRNVTHEFPLKDKPYVENMGRKAEAFTVSAYVFGDNYFDQRDALLAALRVGDAAELVHPYLGTLKVHCNDWSLSETTDEGRMARFSINFIEAGEVEFPSATNDVVTLAFNAADTAKTLAIADFEDSFSTDALADFAVTDAVGKATDAANDILAIAKTVNDLAVGELGFVTEINDFIGDVTTLVQTPATLATRVFSMVEGLTAIASSPLVGIRKLAGLFEFGSDDDEISTATLTRQRQAANRTALNSLVQRAAVIEAARNAPSADYETVQDAVDVRDVIADKLDVIMEDATTSDDVFRSVQALRTQVVRSVPPDPVSLPNLVTVTPVVTQPALVLAYEIYEDASREEEIVMRNKVRHPGFVPGAEPLQVLTDAA